MEALQTFFFARMNENDGHPQCLEWWAIFNSPIEPIVLAKKLIIVYRNTKEEDDFLVLGLESGSNAARLSREPFDWQFANVPEINLGDPYLEMPLMHHKYKNIIYIWTF